MFPGNVDPSPDIPDLSFSTFAEAQEAHDRFDSVSIPIQGAGGLGFTPPETLPTSGVALYSGLVSGTTLPSSTGPSFNYSANLDFQVDFSSNNRLTGEITNMVTNLDNFENPTIEGGAVDIGGRINGNTVGFNFSSTADTTLTQGGVSAEFSIGTTGQNFAYGDGLVLLGRAAPATFEFTSGYSGTTNVSGVAEALRVDD